MNPDEQLQLRLKRKLVDLLDMEAPDIFWAGEVLWTRQVTLERKLVAHVRNAGIRDHRDVVALCYDAVS